MSNKTVAVYELYTAVDHKVTIVNSSYFVHLVATVLWPFFDASYTAKNSRKIEYLVVYGTVEYDRNTVTNKWAKYDEK